MMLPRVRSFIPGKKLLIVRNVAVRLPSTDARQASSLISSIGPGMVKLPPRVRNQNIYWAQVAFDLHSHRLDFAELCDIGNDLDCSSPFTPNVSFDRR
jgi:hypothetical protein